MTTPDPTAVALSLQVSELHERIVGLEDRMSSIEGADAKKYKVRPSISWWDITDETKEQEIARLRGFERDVLLPVLGYHLAPCWPAHLAACIRMEAMHQLFMYLWLSRRTPAILASQAEYFLRQLPGLADDIAAIAKGCEHILKPAEEVAS